MNKWKQLDWALNLAYHYTTILRDGCGECDVAFPCHAGADVCKRIKPFQPPFDGYGGQAGDCGHGSATLPRGAKGSSGDTLSGTAGANGPGEPGGIAGR